MRKKAYKKMIVMLLAASVLLGSTGVLAVEDKAAQTVPHEETGLVAPEPEIPAVPEKGADITPAPEENDAAGQPSASPSTTEPPAETSKPVVPTPDDPKPVVPAPGDPKPVAPAPGDPAPVESAPGDPTTPVDPGFSVPESADPGELDPGFPVEQPSELPEPIPPVEVLPIPEAIGLHSLEDLARIGVDADYPLDGSYSLETDLCGGILTPIGTAEAPFSGVLEGNGHILAGLELTGEDRAGFFGVLSGEVRNLTLLNLTVRTDGTAETAAGLLAGEMLGATVDTVMVTGTVESILAGAVAGIVTDTRFSNVTYHTQSALPAVGEGEAEGALVLRSQPPYIAIVLTQTAQMQADEALGPFAFSHYEYDPELTLEGEGTSVSLTVSGPGRFSLQAIYTCEVEGEPITLSIDIPVIVGEDQAGLEELATLDGVFYTQLGDLEVVQISALAPLELLEGVFTPDLTDEIQQVIGSGEAPINLITSWEQFKNMGNTDYDPDYTMSAVYLLNADIVSDGQPFTPIGTEENPFTGEFDGRTFLINLAANPEIDVTLPYNGLFGVVREPEKPALLTEQPALPGEDPVPSTEVSASPTEAPVPPTEASASPTEAPASPAENPVTDPAGETSGAESGGSDDPAVR